MFSRGWAKRNTRRSPTTKLVESQSLESGILKLYQHSTYIILCERLLLFSCDDTLTRVVIRSFQLGDGFDTRLRQLIISPKIIRRGIKGRWSKRAFEAAFFVIAGRRQK